MILLKRRRDDGYFFTTTIMICVSLSSLLLLQQNYFIGSGAVNAFVVMHPWIRQHQRQSLVRIRSISSTCTPFVQQQQHYQTPEQRSPPSRSSSMLLLTTSAVGDACSEEHVKKAGGGIALVTSGDRKVFDPAIEGKVGESINERIIKGSGYQFPGFSSVSPTTVSSSSASSTATTGINGVEIFDTQNWLEDIGIPTNFAKPTSPVDATVLGRTKLISEDAPGDIQHVVMKLPTNFHYIEGQSLSVIPPGIDNAGKPYKPRLYSIASTRYGDLLDGNTVSLCVRRAEYTDPSTGMIDPSKAGVCSNYLCNLKQGDTVKVAGPVGKTMLLPDDLTKDIIMVATGTGIAPFRGFLHRLFMENTVARHMYTGNAWLILGVPTTGGLLYTDELVAMQQNAMYTGLNNLEVTYAISREMRNKNGGKLYVQDVLSERCDELFNKLDNGAIIYFCGLKGMMPGILTALEEVATSRNIHWPSKLSELMKNHQWHVEVY